MVHYNDASAVMITILKCTYEFFVCESTFVWVPMLQKSYECMNNLTQHHTMHSDQKSSDMIINFPF